jgi:HK97 family phage major capsid protein
MDKLAELRARRAKVAVQMHDLNDLATKEERAFNADETQNWANMEAEVDRIDSEIRRLDKLSTLTRPEPTELRAGGRPADDQIEGRDDASARYGSVFRNFLRNGLDGLEAEERQLMVAHRAQLSNQEQRAFAAGTSNVGGYTVPQGFLNQLEVALKQFGGMTEVADVMYTDNGATLPMPTFNYTAVKATIIGEGSSFTTDSSTPFGVANLGAYTYRSPMLPVSWEFLQDSAFGEGFIADALGRSVAWALNDHATNGTGTSQPRGVITDAVSGKVGTTGQTVSVIYDDLVDLVHAVDPAYRRGALFMMHDSSVKVVRKIKDSSGRPIWLPGYESGVGVNIPDTLLGYAYKVNQEMPVMAANAKSILFGEFKKYKIRIVRDVTMIRLVERYADLGQVGFGMFMRADARLLDAGTNPIKYYQNSAT